MELIRVLVVDDHPGVRAGLRTMLALEPDMEVVAEAADGQEALHRVEEAQPNLVVMDVFMPRLGGIEATRAIKARWPNIRVLMFAFHDTPSLVQRAVAAGADGYLLKGIPPELLVNAIRTVAAGGFVRGGGRGEGET
jgi:DNA-binding NarL/FixJ family response regulator